MRAPVGHRLAPPAGGGRPRRGAAAARGSRAGPRGRREARPDRRARPRTSTPSTRTPHSLVSGYEVFQLTYNLLVDFGPNLEPVPGFADQLGARRRREVVDLPHPRRDEVVGRHAGHVPGRLLLVGRQHRRHRGRGRHRRRLPRPGPHRRRGHEGRVPRRPDDDRLHGGRLAADPPDVRPDPARSTSGASTTTRRSARPTFDGAARRHRAVHRRRSGRRASSSASSGTPTTGARRAPPTRSSSSSSRATTRWSRPSRPARSTTPADPTRTSSRRSRAEPDIEIVAGRPTAGPSSPSTATAPATARRSRTAGPSTKALLDPTFRDALGYAIDKDLLVERVLGGFGDVGHDGHPAGPRRSGTSSRRRRGPSTSSSPSRSSTRPATSSTRAAPASTRKASRSACASYFPDTDALVRQGGPVRPGLVRRARHQGDAAGVRLDDARRPDPAAGGLRGAQLPRVQGRLRHRAVGLVVGRRPERRAPDLHLRRRSARRRTASTATRRTTRCTTQQAAAQTARGARKAIVAEMQNIIYDEARLRHPLLRREPGRLPHRPLRRLAEPADRQRDAVLHLQHAPVHDADRRDGGAVRRRPRPRRSRAPRPRPTPAPSGDGGPRDGDGDNTVLYVGHPGVVIVVAGIALAIVLPAPVRQRARERGGVKRRAP